jgi:adenine-specific DNA-methyltransferase
MQTQIETQIDKKLRGGYYTPKDITTFITKWVISKDTTNILEPSCGDGQFISAAIHRLLELKTDPDKITSKITGIEINPSEARKASKQFTEHSLNPRRAIITGDFFAKCKEMLTKNATFDGILGNPPFIRYQDFPEEYRKPALDLIEKAGLKQNKLMNIWIPFVVGTTLLLRKEGRIGLVLPAELFQVNYAAQVRKYLSDSYSKAIIITFRRLVFLDIQQEVILFLGEKDGVKSHGINIIEVDDINSLNELDLENIVSDLKILESSTEKWTKYFLNKEEINLIKKLKNNASIPLAKEHISVDVGVVTGQNKYFVLNKKDIERFGLGKYTQKIFSRSGQLKGIMALEEDFKESIMNGSANFLLRLPDEDYQKLPSNVQNYIDMGEKTGIHKGYKCRIRKRWWVVPSTWTPDAFMLRQVNTYPKLILNKSNATVTDTVHRVKFIDGAESKLVATAFLNSMTLAFSEITGRSYGGGVLTFEPSEAERLPLPLEGAEKLDTSKIDKLVRNGEIEKVLDITDKVLLKDNLGLSETEIRSLRKIWEKLRDRRLNRK